MSGRKNILITSGLVISVSMITAVLAVVFTLRYSSQLQYRQINDICTMVLKQNPEAQPCISSILKDYTSGNVGQSDEDFLASLGYQSSDFAVHPGSLQASVIHNSGLSSYIIIAVFFVGLLLLILTCLYRNRMEERRIQTLVHYLEQVNTGKAVILSSVGEDEFSKLEDEIYKTVTFLYQTKDAAINAKNCFAENLANIAHQLKTPITAISLAVQMSSQEADRNQINRIGKQLSRLTHLEEALLVLSRLDAGTLVLNRQETDVFTLLMLASDNLQELFTESQTGIDIPELGEMAVLVDLDWTMEAIMNLMKNCMEHNQGGSVHCTYEQNPLYTEILVWDEGEGFSEDDMPYLFERFYRGKQASEGGIGIGLALAKEIIERQNGTIRAKNMPDAGACFEIRLYSH